MEKDLRDVIPDESRRTYREIIWNSTRQARKQSKSFKKDNGELQKERNKLINDLNTDLKTIDRVTGKVLTRPVEVREISDQICDLHQSKINEEVTNRSKRFAEKSVHLVDRESRRAQQKKLLGDRFNDSDSIASSRSTL